MGFFSDIRELQEQAEAMTPPGTNAQRLMASGRPGSASIAALRPADTTGGDEAAIEFDLMVRLDGAEPYRVRHRQAISALAMGRFQPGATVPVHVDPADPRSLVIG